MREDTRTLLEEIAHCPVLVSCKSAHEQPCSRVVDIQRDTALSRHQVPEPWSGHLDQALVLFIGTSPAIARGEDCATWTEPADAMTGYFEDRFGDGPRQIRDGVYPPIPGRHSGTPLQSWVEVKARAAELVDDPVPGVDYAMTHVVHCRTEGELGLRPALTVCPDRYLRRVVRAAVSAYVLVALGPHAGAAVRNLLGIDAGDDARHVGALPIEGRHVGPVTVEGRERHVLFLDHFGGYGSVKEVRDALDADALHAVRRTLAGRRGGAEIQDEPASYVHAAFREMVASFAPGEARWLSGVGRLHDTVLSRVAWLVQRSVAEHGFDVVLRSHPMGFVLRAAPADRRCDYAVVSAADCLSRDGLEQVVGWALDRSLAAVAVNAVVAQDGSVDGHALDEVARVLLPRLGPSVERYRIQENDQPRPAPCLDIYLVG